MSSLISLHGMNPIKYKISLSIKANLMCKCGRGHQDETVRPSFWRPWGLRWLRQEMSLELDSSRLIESHEWDKLGRRTPNRPVYIGPVCPDTTSGCEEGGVRCCMRGECKDKITLSRYYGRNVGDEGWASGPGRSLLRHKTFFSFSDTCV